MSVRGSVVCASGCCDAVSGSLALIRRLPMVLLLRGARSGVLLTLGGRLSIFLNRGQYFLMILVAFRVAGVYLAENTTLCEVFLFHLLFRRLCFSLNWNFVCN